MNKRIHINQLQTKKLRFNKSQLNKSILFLIFSLNYSVVAVAQDNENVDGDSDTLTFDTVIVTGEKIEKNIFENSSSVNVFSDEDNGELKDVYQLASKMVNVVTAPSGLPHIRGMDGRGPTDGYLTYQTGARSRVATIVDGVAESWSGENFGKAAMWDVEQVEIFRGTQSTMQGRNAIAGTIIVNSKMPTQHWETAVRLGYENKDSKYHAAAMLSGPIFKNVLAFRLAVDGLEGNTPISYVKPEGKEYPWDPSQISDRNVRAKLLWQPLTMPNLKTVLTVVNRDSEGQYTNIVSKPYFDYVYDDGKWGTRHQYTDSQTYQLKTEYKFNKDVSADIQLSRRNYHTTFRGFPRSDWFIDLDETNHTLESKLVYDPENASMRGVAGIYLYNRNQNQLLDGFKTKDDTNSQAIFVDTDTNLTDNIGLQLGGRLQNDNQERHFKDSRTDFVINNEKLIFLPSVGISYLPKENLKLAATIKKGYNPAGATHRSSNKEVYRFDQETVWTAEISARSKLAEGRINLGTNLFYSEYDNYQSMLTIPPAKGSSQRWDDAVILNIPKTETYGLEANADAFLQSWKLGTEIGLLSSRIQKAPDNKPELAGNKISYAPSISAGMNVEKFLTDSWSIGGDLRHVGKYFDSVKNDSEQAGGYTQLDLHTTYEHDNGLKLGAYIKNVNDAQYKYRHKGNFAEVSIPRTFGITLDYKY